MRWENIGIKVQTSYQILVSYFVEDYLRTVRSAVEKSEFDTDFFAFCDLRILWLLICFDAFHEFDCVGC